MTAENKPGQPKIYGPTTLDADSPPALKGLEIIVSLALGGVYQGAYWLADRLRSKKEPPKRV